MLLLQAMVLIILLIWMMAGVLGTVIGLFCLNSHDMGAFWLMCGGIALLLVFFQCMIWFRPWLMWLAQQ
jgi:hypothetical protein